MANEAHKEPTMEEILASIRKIISDDDTAPQAAEPTPVETVTEDAVAADSADVDDIDDVMFEEDDSADEDAFEVEFEQFEAEADEVSEPPSFEEMLGAARAVVAAPRAEEAEEIVDIDYQGDSLEIGFNVAYLIDVLNSINSNNVKINLMDANSSALIEDADDGAALYVIMPMRL